MHYAEFTIINRSHTPIDKLTSVSRFCLNILEAVSAKLVIAGSKWCKESDY